MAFSEIIPFQFDRPVFVRVPFTSAGRHLDKGDIFKWLETGVSRETAQILYNQGFLYHDDDKVARENAEIGDGLDALSVDELHALVKKINESVKAKTKNVTEFDRKKCKKSTVKWKQAGLIRSWRNQWGSLED